MRKFIFSLVILFFTTHVFSQTWKDYVDSASKAKSSEAVIGFMTIAKNKLLIDSAGTITYARFANTLADMYKSLGRNIEAEPFYLEAKNIREKKLGKDHTDYLASIIGLASLYKNMKQYHKALPYYLEIKKIKENTLGKENLIYGASIHDLARLYELMGQSKNAEPLYIEIKDIREKLSGKTHPSYAAALIDLANLYDGLGQFEKAEPMYLQAINIFGNALGKEHPAYIKTVNYLAGLYKDLGQFDKAKPLYLEIKNIREKTVGKQDSSYAISVNNLGSLYKDMAQYKKAEPFFEEAKNIVEKISGKAHPDYATSLTYLGLLYIDMGQYQKAEPLILQAKSIREKALGKSHPDYGNSCNNLAILYLDLEQYEKAEPLYLEAKKIQENQLIENDPDYALLLNNIGNFYVKVGQYSKAEPDYLEAIRIYEKNADKYNRYYSAVLYNLAELYYHTGQYEKAEVYYFATKNIREKTLGKEHPLYADCLNNIGSLYLTIREYKKAEPFFLEAKNIREKTLGNTHTYYAESCHNLAILYREMGQYEKSELFFTKAKSIRAIALGKEHPDYAKVCYNFATLYRVAGKPIKADSLYKEAFNINYHKVQKILQFASEKEKATFIENIVGNNDVYNSFYFNGYPHSTAAEPYTVSFLSRNLILSSSQQIRKIINNSNNINLISEYEKWIILKKQLASFYSKQQNGSYIKELEDSANILEKSLTRASAEFKNKQQEKSWMDIQKNLKANETAIEFVEFRYFTGKRWTDSTFYVAILLRKDKAEPILVPLFEKKQLDSILTSTGNKTTNDNVKTLYASRGAGEDDTIIINKSLYKLIWSPLEKELKGINTVYFSPAGLLHRIAFAALPANDKEVLSDKYKLVELSTTANIIDQQPGYVSTSDKINLYGGIKYNVDTTSLKIAAITFHSEKPVIKSLPDDLIKGAAWNDLPGTKKETDGILSVANNKNNITVLSGIQATEESIKALDGKNSPVVIHIATHGFFFPDPKKDEKYNSTVNESGKAFKQSDDPLFRSGLLFAGANNSWTGETIAGIEDGILTSYEVSTMYLPNTKLVVLSACETGLGDIQGAEGVYGLQRAFKMAGVQNLVMSLWKVPDVETAEFMQEFYKNMFAKQSIADAFYHAQTIMKNKYRNDPYKWAAWVLVR